ncbi:putative RNA helicase [Helianthus anomalus]
MAEQEAQLDENFLLFSRKPKPSSKPAIVTATTTTVADNTTTDHLQFVKDTSSNTDTTRLTFADLGLSDWALQTCKELGMKKPTPVQQHCIPRILSGEDVLGLAQTGSGKTAAFALPVLHRLAEGPYGVFCLVVTPTRELAYQLAEQFKALGSCLNLRCAVIVGGMDMISQAKMLMQRPHVVIATPGRIKVLIDQNPDIPAVFSNTKFLVLDEADRVLDVGFEDELRVVFNCLPKNRQTLLFSATMTDNLQSLLEVSANKAYFYEAYEGFQTVDTLKQQYVFIPKSVKDVYLLHILSRMEDMGIRSAIIFVSKCRTCHLLGLLMEELDHDVAELHSHKSQAFRLSALHKFKSGKVSILLATDVASRGLDIPTVDLVINYDIPRYPRDYVHRVGRTARAGRGGLAISLITQNEVELIHDIEKEIGKKMELFECKENEVLENITQVFNARRVAKMKFSDGGFDEIEKTRKAQKMKSLAEKGLLKKNRKRKRKTIVNKVED